MCIPLFIIYIFLQSTINNMLKRVNHQIRPWIFTRRPTPSLNYAKYQFSPWICQTSIKKVPPPCMLCCLVHVARRKPRVQGLIWLNWKKLSFHFSVYFFCFSHFAPALPIHPSSHFRTSKTSLTLLLPAKTSSIFTPPKSPPSPAILTFLKFVCLAVIKGNTFPVVYQVFVFVFTLFLSVFLFWSCCLFCFCECWCPPCSLFVFVAFLRQLFSRINLISD